MSKIKCTNCSKSYAPIYKYTIYIRENTPDMTIKTNYKYKRDLKPIGVICEVCGSLELFDNYFNLTAGKIISIKNPKTIP